MLNNNFYIQMYSLRDETANGILPALKKVADMGYAGVEFAGYKDKTAAELAPEMNAMNLKTISAHIGKDQLIDNLDREIADMKTLGGKYIICPFAPIDSVAAAKEFAPVLNEIGKKVTEAGLVFGYHNHGREFTADNGILPFDVLMENTDPRYVKAQIDVYWVASAGCDPYAQLKKYSGRCPLVHLKQIGEDNANVCLPDGLIDMKRVIETATEGGAEYFILEQEGYPYPPLECAKIAIDYIHSL